MCGGIPFRNVFGDIETVLLVHDGGIPGIQQGLNELQPLLACGGELSSLGGRRESVLVGIHITHEEWRCGRIVRDKPCSRAFQYQNLEQFPISFYKLAHFVSTTFQSVISMAAQ